MISDARKDSETTVDHGSAEPADNGARHPTRDLSFDDHEAAQVLVGLRQGRKALPERCDLQKLTLSSRLDSMDSLARIQHGRNNGADTKIDLALRTSTSVPTQSQESQEVEPLFSIFKSQHPLLSTAVDGSIAAYDLSKSYSPRFKSAAELVEQRIGLPVVSTVTAASRISGADSAARRWLERPESGTVEGSSKRRRTTTDHNRQQQMSIPDQLQSVTATSPPRFHNAVDWDVEQGLQGLRGGGFPLESVDSDSSITEPLPPYDAEGRSPRYDAHEPATQPSDSTWRTQLITSTSGLGVALHEDSLKSLRYCLSWLRWAASTVGQTTSSLKDFLEERETQYRGASDQPADSDGDVEMPSEARDHATAAEDINTLRSTILDTMNRAIKVVSIYAGGALPAIARDQVRKHLLSLPHRFMSISLSNDTSNPSTQSTLVQSTPTNSTGAQGVPTTSTSTNSEKCSREKEIKSAQRVVVLATEFLDMITQVAGIVGGVIQSAENWVNRISRESRSGDGNDDQQARSERQPLEKSGTSQIVFDEKDHFKLLDKEG